MFKTKRKIELLKRSLDVTDRLLIDVSITLLKTQRQLEQTIDKVLELEKRVARNELPSAKTANLAARIALLELNQNKNVTRKKRK